MSIPTKVTEFYKRAKENLEKFESIIFVLSGKGGVGKSLISALIAIALSEKGYKTSIFDSDLHGPSIPELFGVIGASLMVQDDKIVPITTRRGLEIVSIGLALPSRDTPLVWRGPLKTRAIVELLSKSYWHNRDILVVDLPPGTGDEPLTMMQLAPKNSKAIVVTIPSKLSEDIVVKAVHFVNSMNVKLVGIVENMSYVECPRCHYKIPLFPYTAGESIARKYNVRLLAKVPLIPELNYYADSGRIEEYFPQKAAKSLIESIEHIVNALI